MGKIKYATDFSDKRKLVIAVDAKNTLDGVGSPLTGFMTTNKIVLTDDIASGTSAQTFEDARVVNKGVALKIKQQRDVLFNPVFKHLQGAVQVLKKFYGVNYKSLEDWGVHLNTGGEVVYPPSFDERSVLFGKFMMQYATYGAGLSPIEAYLTINKIDLAADTADRNTAVLDNVQFKKANAISVGDTSSRNLIFKKAFADMKKIGGFLMTIYKADPNQLLKWGFTVDNSVPVPKLRTTKIIAGQQKKISGITIGSILTALGNGPIDIYQGKKNLSKKMISMVKGDTWGVPKGCGAITIVNTSTTIPGKITTWIKR